MGAKKDYDILSNRMNKALWRMETKVTPQHVNCVGRGRNSIKRDKSVRKTCHWEPIGCMAYCLRATINYFTSENIDNPIEVAKAEVLAGSLSASEAAQLYDDALTKRASRKIRKRGGNSNLPVKIPKKHREIFDQVLFHPVIENGQEGTRFSK